MEHVNAAPAGGEKPARSPRDFFLYAGVMLSLYFVAVNFIDLVFNLLNIALPDKLDSWSVISASSEIRFNIAAIIVVLPVFVVLSRLIGRALAARPEKLEGTSRKVFVFLTLFITGAAFVVDLVVLLYRFLDGDTSLRFALKALVVLAASAAVFGYYLYDLRAGSGARPHKGAMPISKWSASAAAVVSLAVIAWTFVLIGSPSAQRERRFDAERVSDLQALASGIISYADSTGALPADLAALQKSALYSTYKVADPETGSGYSYKVDSAQTFELCAAFDLASDSNAAPDYSTALYGVNWAHSAGDTCFDFSVKLPPPSAKALPATMEY